MAKPKDNQGGGNPAGIDLATLPALSREQLLEIAKEKGIEVAPEAESEAIIKAITDVVDPKPEDSGGDNGAGGDDQTPQDNQGGGKGIVIVSVKRAGKTISAVTGQPITFDKDGKATVDPRDAEYLTGIAGFEKA